MRRSVSAEGLAFIERLEGFRARPSAMPDGGWVVGFGHVLTDTKGDPITQEKARALLIEDLRPVEALLSDRVLVPVTQSQFDALASFAFSIGIEAFAGSDVLRRLNAGEPIAAALAMQAWRKSSLMGDAQIYDVLVRRRVAEAALFLSAPEPVTAPSAIMRPQLDHAAAILSAPGRIGELPRDAEMVTDDEIARRLARILGSEGATAHALVPPPPPFQPQEEDHPPVSARPEAATADPTGLALVCFVGALLLFGGLFAQQRGADALFLILSPLGAVMLAMGLWGLMRDPKVARR